MNALHEPRPAAFAGSPRWHDLGTRALSSLVLVVVAIASALHGGLPFIAVWLAAAFAVLWEWQRLTGAAASIPALAIGAAALVLCAVAANLLNIDSSFLILAAGCGLVAALAGPGKRVWAAGGMFYAGALLISVVALRAFFEAQSIIWLFATVWATDCFAYFGGRLLGGPKLWRRISPSKTWSGTATGIVFGGLAGTLAILVLPDRSQMGSIGPMLAMSLAAAALSQAGDAFESGIKRRFGVKDSSRLIPGHGGVMDRLDGFIVAAVFAFAVGMIRNVPAVAGGLFYWA